MLQPAERLTLLEALTPPQGFTLEIGVGTTFSLNLLTLITTPWAFAVYEAMAAHDDEEPHQAVGLLDAVRRHADRLTVFCQSGQIAVDGATKLLPLMERSVVPVIDPRGGLFHPKVWVLGFINDADERRHRLLVASRNLTTDRSWDTLLRIEQADDDVRDDGVHLPDTGVLLDWLAAQCTRRIHQARATAIRALASRLADVRWSIPDGFRDLTLHAMGLPGGSSPAVPDHVHRLLVLSPFLSAERLSALPSANTTRTLISTPDALDQLPADLPFDQTFVLDRDATPADPASGTELSAADPATALVGLHAKVLAFDDGWNTTVVTGSANMTTAGWSSNVEVVAALTGRKSRIGIATMVDPQPEKPCLHDLLEPHPPGGGQAEEDPLAGDDLDARRRQLAACTFTGSVTPLDDAAYQVRLRTREDLRPLLYGLTQTWVWPLLFQPQKKVPALDADGRLDLSLRIPSLADVTAFFGIQLCTDDRDTAVTILADLEGLPQNRDRAVLTGILTQQDRLLRYLLLLLADASGAGGLFDQIAWLEANPDGGGWQQSETPLLEALLRAAHRGPDKLAPFDSLLADLGNDAEALLPEGFMPLWDAVQSARTGVRP